MARPHPALIEIAAERPPPGRIDDPDFLVASAIEHRMHGLLWSAVMRGEIELPLDLERSLAALDLETQGRHRRLVAATHHVGSLLSSHGIEVATFKGVAAEARWYDRVGERPTRDVDLWLSPFQLDRVEEPVRLLQPDHPLSGQLQKLTANGHLQSIDVEWSGIWIDLHVDPFKLGIPVRGLDAIWGNRVKSDSGLDALDPAASLVQFLLHLNKDRFSWLLGMADIHRVLNGDLDLDEVVRIADSEGLMVPVSKAMDAVESVLGACSSSPLPKAGGWRATAWDLLWRDQLRLNGDVGFLRAHRRQDLLPLLAPGRVAEGMRFNLRTVFPAPDLLDEYYPEVPGPYPVRLWRGRATRWVERRQMIREANQRASEQTETDRGPRESLSAQSLQGGSKRGSFVVLVGPDGSGKTTLAKALLDRAGESGRYFHFIPTPLNTLERYPSEDGQLVEKNREHGSRILGLLRIGRTWLRAWISYVLSIRPAVRAGSLVVGDRWLYGYLVQPLALKFYGPRWFARLIMRTIPQPDLVAVLDAPMAVIRDRKAELSAEEIESEREAWSSAIHGPRITLDSTLPSQSLADQVLHRLGAAEKWRKYPPLLGHVLIPARPRQAALAGSTLYTAARPRGLTAQRIGRGLIRTLGTRWLPTAKPSDMPFESGHREVISQLLADHGCRHDRIAIYTRSQASRVGYSVLALQGTTPVGFVRVAGTGELDLECQALELLEAFGPASFRHPKLVGRSNAGLVDFVLQSVVLDGYHRPPRRTPPLDAIVAEIQAALAKLPKPEGTPDHWLPMHGDLTPWNLRESGNRLSLIDWETVEWGPPTADQTLYSAASLALGLSRRSEPLSAEASTFWLDRISKTGNSRDERLRAKLIDSLRTSVSDG